MSIHPIPSPANDPADTIRWARMEAVKSLCALYLREPENVTDDGTTLSLVFTPDLTAPQTAILNRIVAISGLLRITPAEWQSIESEIVTMRAFVNEPTPTLAQTVAGLKAVIRTLRALLRD